ncbi:response regulator [Patescibacteria group bacterium]|nr:response regulator [Patescibacteria group bacterium]
MNKTPKILVVDDEVDNLTVLKIYLRDAQYEVESAKSSEEAWKMLISMKGKYDVALLDWMMPGRSGLELLHQMQKHWQFRHIQVIMQTAKARAEEIQQGIEAGAWYYLTKPFAEETLLSIVRTALSDRQNYLDMQQSIRDHTPGVSYGNRFAIRTLEEARNLAALLAKLCHDPEKMGLGFLEILLNAIEHGNLGISYEDKSRLLAEGTWKEEINHRLLLPENKDKFVEVYIDPHENGVSFLIKDQGNGFDWEQYLIFDPRRVTHTHGRGIAMAKHISFDHLEYRGFGNEVFINVDRKEADKSLEVTK